MIKACFARLFITGGLALLGGALSVDNLGLGGALFVVGFIWGTIELFILAGLLFMYGAGGIIHDIKQGQDHDPWGRW